MTYTPHVSASQVDTFNLCQRKWGWQSLAKVKIQNLGAFRGDQGHQILEAYGKFRTPPEQHEAAIVASLKASFQLDLDQKKITAEDYAGRIIACANKMIPLIPCEPPFKRVEEDIRYTLHGVTWWGKVDLQPDTSTVLDYKFSAGADWAKTAEDLLTDVQAVSYAWWKFATDSPEVVNLRWLYGIPGAKPRAFMVKQTVTPEHVREAMKPHTETGQRLVELHLKRPDVLALEPNWTACEKLGGCPFQDRCSPTAEQMMIAFMSKDDDTANKKEAKKMGLIGSLKKKSEETGAVSAADIAKAAQNTEPVKNATPDTAARSDDAGAKAECSAQAKTLVGLGVGREDVAKTLQKRFVGLPVETILQIVEIAIEAALKLATPGQPINPPDSPKEPETKVEEKAAKKGPGRPKKDAEAPASAPTPPAPGSVTGDQVTPLIRALVAAAAINGLAVEIRFTAKA